MTHSDASPPLSEVRPILITGGAGFIGSNIADRLASSGHHVLIYDSLARPGVEDNLDWLIGRHPALISATRADVRDAHGLSAAVREASAVIHLAAQVAVTTSLDDPLADFEINARATVTVLEALNNG